jgi:2'-5' RNA ligase
MENMKRTFIAVRLKHCSELAELSEKIRELLKHDSVKWVDINNMHITLAFLGDTPGDKVSKVSEMIQRQCGGFGTLTFTIAGLGVFKSFREPRVIWAGIEKYDRLKAMALSVKTGLEELGIETEEREFKPHLTLGRIRHIKNRGLLKELTEEYRGRIFREVTIEEVIYFESLLHQHGPEYKPLSVISL